MVSFLGFSSLDFDTYIEHLDYWYGVLGVELPLWAEEVASQGTTPTCAIDFYDDLFGSTLEEHRDPGDYRTGDYGAIVIEQVPLGFFSKNTKITNKKSMTKKSKNKKDDFFCRRITVTQGNFELYDLIDSSNNTCIISPISYAGKNRTNKNARYCYAMVIEIDNIQPKNGITELFYSWERKKLPMPKPTYIVCSGTGLHLYYFFTQPLPMIKPVFNRLADIKNYFTTLFWNKYITTSYKSGEIQYESVSQPFRCVGTVAKNRRAYAMAFKVGEKIPVEYFNAFLPRNKQFKDIHISDLPLEKAKDLYPIWYQNRIIDGKEPGHWTRNQGIYYNWIEKIKDGAVVGRRYNCLENLCSLAVQCNIPLEQVKKDCTEIAEFFEELTESDDNHFTDYDVRCALKTYYKADQSAYTRRIDIISKKTGIELTPNKRNGRKQATHLKIARSTLAIMNEDNGQALQGRPKGCSKQRRIVMDWRANHPEGKKADCIRDTGLSKPTVYRWWDSPPIDRLQQAIIDIFSS